MSEDYLRRVRDYKGVGGKLLTSQRRITVGRDLSGGIALLIEGQEDIVMSPDHALGFAKAIFELLGARVQINEQKKIVHAAG